MFTQFPTPQEFADVTGLHPGSAEKLLDYIADAVGTDYGVSRQACEMAYHAIKAGMDWGHIAAIFASWYDDFKRRQNANAS